MSLLPDTDRILLGPGPSLTSPRVMRAMAAPTLSHLDPLMMRLLDDVRARLSRLFGAADGSFAFAVSGTGTSGMETAVANLVQEGTRAHGHRHRLLRRPSRADVRAVRRDRHAAERRMGPGRAIPEALRTAADEGARRRRGDGARGDVDRRPEPGAAAGRDRARARRADDRRCRHVVRRHPLRRRRVGHRRLLQLHAEMSGRAVRARAGRLRPASARAARQVPQLLLRSLAARGLLAAPQVPPHDVVRRWCTRCTKRSPIVEEEGLDARWARHERNHRALVDGASRIWTCRCCRPKASGSGPSTRSACRTASTRPPCASTCSTSSTSRSALASDRWPARSGASA